MVTERVINTHDQLVRSGGGIAIVPAMMPGRRPHQNGWGVYRVNADGKQLITDKKAAWYDHCRKTFSEFGCSREDALKEAQEWVKATYGEEGPWVRNRQKDWVPERVNSAFPIPGKPRKTKVTSPESTE
jgi:hypothetical protein